MSEPNSLSDSSTSIKEEKTKACFSDIPEAQNECARIIYLRSRVEESEARVSRAEQKLDTLVKDVKKLEALSDWFERQNLLPDKEEAATSFKINIPKSKNSQDTFKDKDTDSRPTKKETLDKKSL